MSYFRESTKNGMTSLNANANIITKINVPKYLFLFSRNVSAIINFGLTIIIFFFFCIIDHVTFKPSMLMLWYPILCLVIMNLGIGMILSAIYVFFRDTTYLYDIFLTLLNYLSAVFYTIDRFPVEAQRYFLLNPVYVIIKYWRTIVIQATIPSVQYHLLMAFYALAFLALGAYMYKKYNHQFLYFF
jgi:ABC-type polysaccharide/polyol phosphate export permease